MSAGTKIQWCDDTWNPWRGCRRVSPGCANCYIVYTPPFRLTGQKHGAERVRASAKVLAAPVRWNQQPWVCDLCGYCCAVQAVWCVRCGNYCTWHRRRVFSLSLGDWLDHEVSIEWLAEMLEMIHVTPELDYLLLSKRLENWQSRLADVRTWGHQVKGQFSNNGTAAGLASLWLTGNPPPNLWLGASVEDQPRAQERIPQLLKIPAKIHFLSVEPMLERILFEQAAATGSAVTSDFTSKWGADYGLQWVIFGGESGPGARPCNIEWIRDGVRQCRAAGVAPFVKQLGSHAYGVPFPHHKWASNYKLQDKNGGNPIEWPVDLHVREFPEATQPASA